MKTDLKFISSFFKWTLPLLFLFMAAFTANAYQLPDTGQTNCYDASGATANVIPCAGTGQDGAYTFNPMSFTDNGNGTVTDNKTGLLWQKQDNGSTYNWYVASGIYNGAFNEVTQDICGSLVLGGYSDWRLPSKKELISIVNYGISSPGPTIEAAFFPNTKSGIGEYYWSSTLYVAAVTDAVTVNFRYGNNVNISHSSAAYVRCVRGNPVAGNMVDNGNGTVTDNKTGLVWQQGEGGLMFWDSALAYCENLNLAGATDWRLPNVKELESITDDSVYNPSIDTDFFPGAFASDYWPSTSDATYPDYGWVVNFNDGRAMEDNTKTDDNYVRCVRGGTSGPPVLKADYQFQNTLTSSVGSAPSLGNIGGGSNTFISDTVGGAATTVLEFPQHNGLLLSPVSSVILNNTYTIAVIFSFDNTDSYRRIVDFKDSSNDNGLYNYYGKLVFYNNALGVASATISSGAYVQAVITRDSAKNVKGYVNGVQQFAFVDSSDDAAISANDKLKFFRDNTSGSGLNEASSGTVSRIRIYDGALSAADVSALESAAVTYTLDTAKSGLGGGTTLGAGTYNSGSTATLTATADAVSTFTGWSGDCSGTVSPVNVVMDGDKTCTANFSLITYTLTAVKSGTGSGTVTSSIAGINCGSDCSESYNYGAAVELFASPAVGSLFAGWAGGGCSGTAPCIVTLVSDTTVTASFAVKTFTVTPTAPIGGSIGPNTAQSVLYNGTTSFTVVPEAGFSIASVTGCGGTLTGSTYTTGPVTSDCNVTATFKFNYPVPVTYTLTAGRSGTGNGTVTSSIAGINCGEDCTESYSQGQSITLAAKADKDSLFAGWTGCDKVSGAYCTVLLTGNKTVTAKFEQSAPKIEVSITALDFGEVKVGRLRYRSFKVNNTGTGNLVIGAETVGTDAELFKKAPAGKKTIKPNNSATLRVMFRPNSPGEKTATLSITSNDADTPVREIVLTGTGK